MAGVEAFLSLLSGQPMASMLPPGGMVAPATMDSNGGIPAALAALLMPQPSAVAPPMGMSGGMSGGLAPGFPGMTAPGVKSDRMPQATPRITNNTAAAAPTIEADAEVASPAGPSFMDKISSGAGDVFGAVAPNPASGFASFAGGFSGERKNSAARAKAARDDAEHAEDRTWKKEDRVFDRKYKMASLGRSGAASARAERTAELNNELTRARIEEIRAGRRAGERPVTGPQLKRWEDEAADKYAKSIGATGTGYVSRADRAEQEKKITAFRAQWRDEMQAVIREGYGASSKPDTGAGPAAGVTATRSVGPATGAGPAGKPVTTTTVLPRDQQAKAMSGQVFVTPTGTWKWNGQAWVKA